MSRLPDWPYPLRGGTMARAGYEVAVIGGGIVGVATAVALLRARRRSLLLLEAEAALGLHQTGHNSGVIHAGVYYRPGSLKASLGRRGREALYAFCRDRGVRYEQCGKLIVASSQAELPALAELERRALANGLCGVRQCGPEELREREPAAVGVAALHVPQTGIVDFREVTGALAELAQELGAEIRTGARVQASAAEGGGFFLATSAGDLRVSRVVNCAGLQSDRVARLCGLEPGVSIVPFRGEYYQLRADRRALVRALIYPVPDPALPFLGAHFTRTIHGQVEAGPNAILALARNGYRWSTISPRDIAEMARNAGFRRMARRHWRVGLSEMRRSLSKAAFTKALQRLVPATEENDLEPAAAGVRAQAVAPDGRLLDDFHFVEAPGMLHVLNAPSPGATASLAIGEVIASRLDGGSCL